MSIQSSNAMLAGDAFAAIRSNAAGWKSQAQGALVSLSGTVSADFVFRLLDQLGGAILALTSWKSVAGLDAYATSQGYVGTVSADCANTIAAANSCVAWVVANFPNSAGFLQSATLNADGSRTSRTFTTSQTLGLQSALTSFVSTIS